MSKSKAAAATLNNAQKTQPPQLAPHAFQPGNTLGKGRPKGSRNKLGEDFLSALQQDFSEHGVAAITKVREDRPHEYLKVVASILPKEAACTARAAWKAARARAAASAARAASSRSITRTRSSTAGNQATGASRSRPT